MEQIKITHKVNSRSKSLSIKILKDNSVVVTRPNGISLKRAEAFLNLNKELVLKRINDNPVSYFELEKTYTSKFHTFKISKNLRNTNTQRILNQRLSIKIASESHENAIESQEFIRNAILRLLKIEAKLHLPKRIYELAEIKSLKFNQVKINSAKTRWGSCNQKNDINLSCYLMILPYHLIDYVILHELAHTVHKNHSSQFYQLLNQLTGGQHLELNQELKKNSLGIQALYFQKSLN